MGRSWAHGNLSYDSSCFYLPNPEFERVNERHITNLVTGVINGLTSPFSLVANVLIIFSIWRKPSLQTPSNILLGCLATSDVLVGLVVQPAYVAYRLLENRYSFVPCAVRMLYSTGFYVCYGVSFTTLCVISCERLVAMLYPLRYPDIVRRSRVLKAAILIWLINTSLTFFQWAENDVARPIHLSLWLTSLLIAVTCQCRILPIILRHQRQIKRLQQYSCVYRQSAAQMQVKLAVNITCIVAIYFAFNLPVLLVTKYHQVVFGHIQSYNFYSWAETVAFLNSFLNPMICFWRVKGIRKAIVEMCPRNKLPDMRNAACLELPQNDVVLARFRYQVEPQLVIL